jgi:hypothetical protein
MFAPPPYLFWQILCGIFAVALVWSLMRSQRGATVPLALFDLPTDRLHQVIRNTAVGIGATEAAAFSGESDELPLLVHIRPDNADDEIRSKALAAFREIVRTCVNKRRDGVIEVGQSDPSMRKLFCLVRICGERKSSQGAAAFIVRCHDQEEAQRLLKCMRLLLRATTT